MKLYDMLSKTVYWQKVAIFENNASDQNMPIFTGDVDGARNDTDDVFWVLGKEVERYEYVNGVLVISIVNEYYEERLEEHYAYSHRWTDENRPWLFSAEIKDYIGKKFSE